MEYRLYHASGKAPMSGIILLVLSGFLGCCILESVSVLLLAFLSNLFLRSLAVVIPIALMISFLVLMVRVGKIRNITVVRICVLVLLILSFYFSRVVYVDMVESLWNVGANEFLKGDEPRREFAVRLLQLLIRPDIVFSALLRILPYGTTSINGTMLTGVPLLLMWILEALCFILVPFYLTVYFAQRPYDEDLNMWFPRKEEWHVGYVENYRQIRAEMRKGNVRLLLSGLKELEAYQLQGQESYGILTFYLKGKVVGPYVSLVNIKAVQSGPRKLEHRTITLCRMLNIGRETAEELYNRIKDSYETQSKSSVKPKFGDRIQRASFDLNRASKLMVQGMKTSGDDVLSQKTLTDEMPSLPEQLSLDDLKRGAEEITVHVPHVTPEMEKEYLNRKKD